MNHYFFLLKNDNIGDVRQPEILRKNTPIIALQRRHCLIPTKRLLDSLDYLLLPLVSIQFFFYVYVSLCLFLSRHFLPFLYIALNTRSFMIFILFHLRLLNRLVIVTPAHRWGYVGFSDRQSSTFNPSSWLPPVKYLLLRLFRPL